MQIIAFAVKAVGPPFPVFIIAYVLNGVGMALEVCHTPFLQLRAEYLEGRPCKWIRRIFEIACGNQDGYHARCLWLDFFFLLQPFLTLSKALVHLPRRSLQLNSRRCTDGPSTSWSR